jgi:iron complex transport system ATP-binding protein
MMRADHITVRRGGRALLDDVSIAVRPGEIVALIGANGAGKSTLVRVLSGEMRPDRGQVNVDDKPLAHWKSDALARRRAVLPQVRGVDFPVSALAVIELGRSPYFDTVLRREDRHAMAASVARAGIETLLTRDYATLSGGEQQRVQLARVLAQIWRGAATDEPRYLLLDEPTSALDLAHQHAMLDTLQALRADGIGVLAILHDLGLAAAFADRAVALKNGRVIADGDAAVVLRADVIAETYGIDRAALARVEAKRAAFMQCTG